MRGRRGRKAPAPLTGRVTVPGDKSISHRALILAALASGRSEIGSPNVGHDVRATATLLSQLGVECRVDAANPTAQVEGRGWSGFAEPGDVLDAGNSGTTLRLLLGVCAAIPASSILTGDASLRRRPMLRVVAPLRQMGAAIDGRAHGDLPPLAVRGGDLEGVDLELSVASAQVKSALLLAGLAARGHTVVSEPMPTRDHTERMLAATGVEVRRAGTRVGVSGGGEIQPFRIDVPGDMSSAMFLVAAAAIVPGSELELVGVGVNPTRTAALDVLREMGAAITVEQSSESLGEPIGTIRISQRELRGVAVTERAIPALIDEIPALAIVASQADGETTFSNAGELRVKESDRIRAIVSGLRALGADADELDDGLVVRGPTSFVGGEVDSHGDHRIALAFAVAGLAARDPVRVRGWSCVDTSFPEFLDLVGQVTDRR